MTLACKRRRDYDTKEAEGKRDPREAQRKGGTERERTQESGKEGAGMIQRKMVGLFCKRAL